MDTIQRYRIGSATVTRVIELELPEIPSAYLFPERDRTILVSHPPAWIGRESVSQGGEALALSVHSWIVQTGDRTILIDTGAGNGKSRPLNPIFDHLDTPYLERLAAAGVHPNEIDFVLITHLHVDHVGWNTVRQGDAWVPTFPNATYVFSDAEYRFYADATHVQTPSAGVFEDSVQPIIDAGRAVLIDVRAKATLDGLDGFMFYQTRGHSFDHLSIGFTSNGEHALFSGDVMHHPIQVARPDWNSTFCEFPDDAQRSRLWALNHAADQKASFFSSHFPGSSVGLVERHGGGFVWIPR